VIDCPFPPPERRLLAHRPRLSCAAFPFPSPRSVYLWMRIRSLRLDPTAYSALRAGPDGEIDNTIQ
jgi:hypothetical protein